MSQQHSGNSVLVALTLTGLVFVVALAVLIFVGEFDLNGAVFLAALIAVVAGLVLYLGFGSPSEPVSSNRAGMAPTVQSSATSSASAAAAAMAEADRQQAAEAASAIAARKQADAEEAAARKAAEEAEAAARAEAEAAAAAAREPEASARVAEAEAAEAAASAPIETAASVETTPDYDGDGKLEGTNEGTRPVGLDAPRGGSADDLKQIKGIGPKLEKLCNSLGFWHFDQIAAWTADEVAWVDANLTGFKGRVTRDTWVEQAKILASGGDTEFSKRVEGGDVY